MQSDPVTVLVFQNNSSARTFRIPLGWFSRFGLLLGALVAFATLSSLTAAWYFWKARGLGPARVQGLEQEIDELRAKLLASQSSSRPSSEGASVGTPAASAPVTIPESSISPQPPPVQDPPTTIQASAASGPNVFFGSAPLLRSGKPLPAPNTLPIRLSAVQTQWQGRSLRVKFNIQYVANDGQHQTGRIIVLARGPQMILGYPKGVLDAPSMTSIIDFSKGEYFSVGRFREVQADLGSIESKDSIEEVVALILAQNGDPLLIERHELANGTRTGTAPKTLPTVKAAPIPPVQAPPSAEETSPQ